MLPEARIVHQTPDRVRLKLFAYQGNGEAMSNLVRGLAGYRKTVSVKAGVSTGSVVISGKEIHTGTLDSYAQSHNLFRLVEFENPPRRSLTAKVIAAAQDLNGGIGQLTRGSWDLPGTVFVALLTFGVVEILRGNFKSPPWYTAFWYAFGLFTKSMLDKLDDTANSDPADHSPVHRSSSPQHS